MQANKKGLLLLIAVQTCCIAAGLSFHYFYCSSALSHAEEESVRSQLAQPLRQLTADSGKLEALLKDAEALRNLFQRCQFTQLRDSTACLLDGNGYIAAASSTTSFSHGSLIQLSRATASWGHFDAPIHGVLTEGQRTPAIAIAQPLAGRDGYLLLVGMPGDMKVSSASLRDTFREASGITLLWTCGLLCVTFYMIMSYFQNEQVRSRVQPELEALKQAQTLVRTQESIIFGLAKLSDSRDSDTGNHLERISQYATMLASALRQRPEFHDTVTTDFVKLIGISSALHDIGKVGVTDAILRKPAQLTVAERVEMQEHTEIGEECLREIERRLGTSNFLQMAREIAAAHHERWDGSGYPRGLAGEQIPLSARIVAVADVYDALVSKRVYKEAMPHKQCVAQIAEAAGSHFDPRIVEVFLQIQDRFQQIARQFTAASESLMPVERRGIAPAEGRQTLPTECDIRSNPAATLGAAEQLLAEAAQDV